MTVNRLMLRQLCETFLAGDVPESTFLERCLQSASAAIDTAHVDVQRSTRCGFPEVIYAEGKSVESVVSIVRVLHEAGEPVLATRTSADQQEVLGREFPDASIDVVARTFRLARPRQDTDERTRDRGAAMGRVAVVSAGTCDRPVALEARETLLWMDIDTWLLEDVGVAGPHRLTGYVERLRTMDAVVVVAGFEGALPSVVGGYLNCPVIAVPTSVGYGASFQGVAALLGMLNSCASNVAVVNIDAGFKAGYLAGLIAHQGRLAAQRDDESSDARPSS